MLSAEIGFRAGHQAGNTMTIAVNGATRLHIIVGDPIAQVQSPSGMTQAFAAQGYNAVLVPAHVAPADLPDFLRAVSRVRNLDGIIATIPHKFTCYGFCSSTSERAQITGAVNIMRRAPDGGWFGDMLDGLGFIGAIRAKGCEPEGRRALVVGAGGAGTAIACSLLEAGVTELAIHDTDSKRRDALISRLTAQKKARVSAGSDDPTGFELIVNATPAGMRPGDPYPIDANRLRPDMFVGCVITSPEVSPIVAAARRLGCRTSVGGDMYAAEKQLMLDFLLAGTMSA
jgi:shikimate 5-dehydrogenase